MDYYDVKVDSFPLEVGSLVHLHGENVSGFPQLSKFFSMGDTYPRKSDW